MVLIGKKAAARTLVASIVLPIIGCGSPGAPIPSTATAGPSGKSIQGAVNGATIFADDETTGTKFSVDSAESSSQTNSSSSGTFTLKQTPNYKYVLVSQAGTDTLTAKPATTMLAPGGAKAISPLTSMVMLDTTGALATTFGSLLPNGESFDTDFTQNGALNPASMVFVTAVSTALTTFNETIRDAAARSNANISQLQYNVVSILVYSQLAAQFSKLTAAQLSNTATLAQAMQAAFTNAIGLIDQTNSNLSIPQSIAATIANTSVAVAANIVGNATNNAALKAITAANVQTAPGVDVSTTPGLTEGVVDSGTNLQLLKDTITNTAAGASTSVSVTSTPPGYTPPPITVANNPTVTEYDLIVTANGSSYQVRTFSITFSDDMVASQSGASDYTHSVLNPANYALSQSGCSPTSYTAKVVSFTCGNLQVGSLSVAVLKGSATGGVWASSTSLGLLVDNTKTFTLPFITGSTGGTTSLF